MSERQHNEQVAELEVALVEAGYRLTAARRAILEALAASGGHVSADDLVELVHEHDTGVGRMTVYRTLDLLCQIGLLRPVYQGSGAAHYVLLDEGHHHHLVCNECGHVIEFDDCVLGQIEDVIGRRFGFQVEGHLLEFFGRCRRCQDR